MMITKLFYFDLCGKNFRPKIFDLKNFEQKLRHQVVEVEAVEAEAIQKLPLPHPCLKPTFFHRIPTRHKLMTNNCFL